MCVAQVRLVSSQPCLHVVDCCKTVWQCVVYCDVQSWHGLENYKKTMRKNARRNGIKSQVADDIFKSEYVLLVVQFCASL